MNRCMVITCNILSFNTKRPWEFNIYAFATWKNLYILKYIHKSSWELFIDYIDRYLFSYDDLKYTKNGGKIELYPVIQKHINHTDKFSKLKWCVLYRYCHNRLLVARSTVSFVHILADNIIVLSYYVVEKYIGER